MSTERVPLVEQVVAQRLKKAKRTAAVERRLLKASLVVGVALTSVIIILCAVQPFLPIPSPIEQDYESVLQGPSLSHLMGTDDLGRDVFSRTLAAGRIDLPVALLVTLLSVVIGLGMGALAGFFGGRVDALISRTIDVVIAFPFIVVVIVIIAIAGPGLLGIIIGVPLVGWAVYARLTRAEMLVLRRQEFMLATEVLGFSRRRAMFRHAVPNVWRVCLAYAVIDLVLNLLVVASLSFLGLGVKPPTPEWGAIISGGQNYLFTAWWISILPGIFVVLLGVGVSLIGDAIADYTGRDLSLAED